MSDAQHIEATSAEQVLLKLCDTIEATGGIKQDPFGMYYPIADDEWIDLAEIYVEACRVLCREPKIVEEGP